MSTIPWLKPQAKAGIAGLTLRSGSVLQPNRWKAYLDDIQSTLGMQIIGSWGDSEGLIQHGLYVEQGYQVSDLHIGAPLHG